MNKNIFYPTEAINRGFPKCVIQGFKTPRQDKSEIDCFICSAASDLTAKPTIVLLDGSGGRSVFTREIHDGRERFYSPFLFSSLEKYIDEWNMVVFQKRGVYFNETKGDTDVSSEFKANYNLRQRIKDTDSVIEYLYLLRQSLKN